MRKKSVLVFAVVLSLMIPFYALALPSKKEVKKAYREFCAQNNNIFVKQIDIDRNGIKELLYYTQNYEVGVCTYDSSTKQIVKLNESGAGRASLYTFPFYYNKKEGLFSQYALVTHGWSYHIYKISGTSISKYKTLSYTPIYASNRDSEKYMINDTYVSSDVFNSQMDELKRFRSITINMPEALKGK